MNIWSRTGTRFSPLQSDNRFNGHRRSTLTRSMTKSTTKQLLDSFWEARGVLDPGHRKLLVDAAEELEAEVLHPLDTAPLAVDVPLPGLPATWQLEESTPEVLAVSRRLLALQQMLGGGPRDGGSSSRIGGSSGLGSGGASGGGGIDVVWMVLREPGLLSADLSQITQRLLEMKLATYGMDVDVLKVIESQPALLLSDRWRLDLETLQSSTSTEADPSERMAATSAATSNPTRASSEPTARSSVAPEASPGRGTGEEDDGAASTTGRTAAAAASAATGLPYGGGTGGGGGGDSNPAVRGGEAVQQLVQAWQYGVVSDSDREWAERLAQLSTYVGLHGDACAGFREGDDPGLSRWATKQRADHKRGQLAADRLEQLSGLGFHFDADEAEWCRWFSELLAFKRETGHASPMPLVTGGDMYLINWSSVQRIARRSRVLSESRIQRLDEAGFDWTGADPLS